jgi:soluble lytic murein transglycosylase-like protein/LysM repeat protein
LLYGGSVAPLHAQQRAGAHVSRSAARLPSQRAIERGARLPSSERERRQHVKVGVRAGDTLASLGLRFNTTAAEVARLNGLEADAALRPGQQIKVPRRLKGETLAQTSNEADAEATSSPSPAARKSLSLVDGTSIEVDDVWEDAQGVWYRRSGITNLVERERVTRIERGGGDDDESSETKGASTYAPKAKIVEVSAAQEADAAPEPVWIYLVGGARVEADSVTETADGAWYRRGILSIFLERARIERIEREREPVVAGAGGAKRSWTERGWSTGNARLDALIRQNGARYGVDPYLIFCVMEQESHFNARVVSPKGAQGLMQLMPGTAARFGVRRSFDPAENIMGGTRYLKMLLNSFGNRVELVLASYNAGEGAVMKYGGRVPPYKETRNYVRRISARYEKSRPQAAPPAPAGGAAVARASGLK